MTESKIFKDKEEFKKRYLELFGEELGKKFEDCNAKERYAILAKLVASEAKEIGALQQIRTAYPIRH